MARAGASAVPHAFGGWAAALLRAAKLPVTQQNVTFLDNWQATEGGKATYNPLNTTEPAPGATPLAGNPAGVKNYPTGAAGIAATAKTLENGRYPAVVAALRSGDPFAHMIKGGKPVVDPLAQELETWGSNKYALTLAYEETGMPPPDMPGDKQTQATVDQTTGQTTTSTVTGPSWFGGLTGWLGGHAAYAFTWLGLVLFAIVLGILGLLKLLGVQPGGLLRNGVKSAVEAA